MIAEPHVLPSSVGLYLLRTTKIDLGYAQASCMCIVCTYIYTYRQIQMLLTYLHYIQAHIYVSICFLNYSSTDRKYPRSPSIKAAR